MSDTFASTIGSEAKQGSLAGGASFSPLYQQIKQLLLRALDLGEWKPGEVIPSEFELAARFQVSQGTVRKAIDDLAAENILMRRQGKGTFVSTHHEPHVRFRFLRLAASEGGTSPTQSNVLSCQRVRANAHAAQQLDLKVGESLVFIRRVLSFDGVVTVVDDIFLPSALFKGLTTSLLDAHLGVPLYGLFETEFGVSMVRAQEQIRAVAASAEIASLLNIKKNDPLLRVDRTSYTYADRPVELRIGHYLTDQYYYRNTLI
jgi:GntR family transcriptional regulator